MFGVTSAEQDAVPAGSSRAPLAFAIPGNHDWYDGLFAFSRCILDRDWLGGWRLPQRCTYFCLQLPRGWWIFALDQALGEVRARCPPLAPAAPRPDARSRTLTGGS
jgi:hypothetical protein